MFNDEDLKRLKAYLAQENPGPKNFSTLAKIRPLLARLEAAEKVVLSADYIARHRNCDPAIAGIVKFTMLADRIKAWRKAAGK